MFADAYRLLARRALIATVMSSALALAVPARAEVKGLEIIAPAGPGGGYDQLARATQEVLQAKQLAAGVQVQNIPGAGGTIGLAQFVTKGSRNPSLLVAGLGMVGAIAVNKSPVTLDQVQPLARLTGEFQPLVVAAELADQVGGRSAGPVQGRPGLGQLGRLRARLARPHPVRADRQGVRRGCRQDELHRRRRRRRDAGAGHGRPSHRRDRRPQRDGAADPDRQAAGDRHLLAGAAAGRRHPDLQGAGCRRDTGQLARPDGAGEDAAGRHEGTRRRRWARWSAATEWQALLKERGWVDMYQPAEEFAAFLSRSGHGSKASCGMSG